MTSRDSAGRQRLSSERRRCAISLAYANGGLWGLGSGLAGSSLFSYLAIEYGATGFILSLLFAVPHLVGLLRLTTPIWLERIGDRRQFTVMGFLLSALLLLLLPIASAPRLLPSQISSLAALVGCWTAYHLFEYVAVVALWSWFRDLVPEPVRGRFIGRREAWMNAGRVVGTLSGAGVTLWWESHLTESQLPQMKWMGLAGCAVAGATLMLAAIAPLTRMPNVNTGANRPTSWHNHARLADLMAPFADTRFRRFLIYGTGFSLANGLTASAQRIFMAAELNIRYGEKRLLDASSRGIQALVMPACGGQVDRKGNIPVLAISQSFVAGAMLFLLLAAPAAKWWVVGAYVCWIAYAGTNVAQPNLMLGLSPPDNCAAYTAAWFAWTQLVYAASALAGGVLFDWLAAVFEPYDGVFSGRSIDHYTAIFAIGFFAKTACVPLAMRVPEPER